MTSSSSSDSSLASLMRLVQVNQLESGEELASLRTALETLDELIRKDKSVRGAIEDDFYVIMLKKLKILVTSDVRWHELSLILKCIKNSAGIFRDRICDGERDLCKFLLDRLLGPNC